MTQTLSHPLSPLEQARRNPRIPQLSVLDQLSPPDRLALTQVLSGKRTYVSHKMFGHPDAPRKIFTDAPPIRRPDTSWYHSVMVNLAPAHLQGRAGTTLLTAAEERVLFLQFNYCRYALAKLCDPAAQDALDLATARQALAWHRKAQAYRDQITQTNLALVLAMAKRSRLSAADFADLVSEGNMALLRAIDKFDVSRGFKFSTYACQAILKAFSRASAKLARYRQVFPTDFDPKLQRSDFMARKREGQKDDCVDDVRRILQDNRADLTEVERTVLGHRFALPPRPPQTPDAHPLTLEQVGRIIGVTKERVRQIQNQAFEKIRQALASEVPG
jgi:RNA polymerase sigma factor (sigma-70 family)